MANVMLVRILLRLYARAKGELEVLEAPPKPYRVRRAQDREQRDLDAPERVARAENLRELLAAIEVVVHWEVPDWDPTEVKSVAPRRRHQTIGYGAVSTAATDVMREGGSRPQTIAEVAEAVCGRLGLDWSGDNRDRYRDLVWSAVRRLADAGLVQHDDAPRGRRYWISDEDDD